MVGASHVTAFLVLLTTLIPTAAQDAPAAASIEYDAFMQMDVHGRIRAFNTITPENKAQLVRTQIERWLEKNRSRLNAEQIQVMEENRAFVTADTYRLPTNPQKMEQAKALEAKTAALFSGSDMREAITIRGTYIPKK